ncbi:transcription initiation factor IIA subunit 1 isoform X2 [Microplitis mediator]|uniref:transcription initiation factor IIA subunit 1 isoform X2 n=1 Tax=Microplitis mediator TaxID=375433 RepID=UPI002552DA3B|nr:transcription initiation factor IIA subunit 1 isoform X2 [Microplitis mediator]
MALSQTSVLKLYNTVIDDVINGVKDSLCTEEGVDEGVLEELRQIWESKLIQSKAVEINSDPPEPQPPQITILKNSGANKGVTSSNAANVGNHFAQQQMQAVSTTTQSQSHVQQQTPQQLIQTQSQSQPQPVRVANQQTTNLPAQQHATMPVQQVVTAPALFERQVPIQITLPGNASTGDGNPKVLTIHVPASAIQSNQLHTILTGSVITAAMGFPESVASKLLQQHVDKTLQAQSTLPMEINQAQGNIAQLDGPHGDTSEDEDDEDDEDDNDDDDDDLEKDDDEQDDAGAREEEPLNSEDDVTDDDPTDLFDTDNVVVCQYDKITRSRNKWKFYLKDGIMNLSGKDYVFQKANGDAEW